MVLVRLRAFLGVLDWPVPPMAQTSTRAYLGEVKHYHEEWYFNSEAERAADRELVQRHSEEACDSINLGRFSKQLMPDSVIHNIITHLTEPVMPLYKDLDGKAASYFLRLWEFRNPTFELHGELYGERKCDVLKVLQSTSFEEIGLQANWWLPCE